MKSYALISKQKMQGSTLLEVMVSVFLLTFGVLALMLTQVRSVVSIGEAENRTLIAQAAEALAEGMQVNPTVEERRGSRDLIFSYQAYINVVGAKGKVVSNKTFKDLDKLVQGAYSQVLANQKKEGLARAQLDNFEASLSQIPDVANIYYAICHGTDTPNAPTINGNTFNPNCNGSRNQSGAVIKVAWQMKDTTVNDPNGMTTFTYTLKVKG